MTYTITNNSQFNSIEIYFDGKPSAAIRDTLKAMKFRWHGQKKCWYGYKAEAETRRAIDAAIDPEAAYTVQTRGGYLGAIAWDGSNSHKGLYGAELSKALRQAFKTVGINGVTVSCKTYTGGQHITLKIKAGPECFLTLDEFTAASKWTDFARFSWVHDFDLGRDVLTDDAYNWDSDKIGRQTRALAAAEYERYTAHESDLNYYHLDNYKMLSPAFVEKLHTIKRVVDSFNYDDSNSMVDYFDRGFYETWRLVPDGATA